MDILLSFIIASFYSFLGIFFTAILLKYFGRKHIRQIIKYEILGIVAFSVFILTFISHISVSSEVLDNEKFQIKMQEEIQIQKNSFVSFPVFLENGYEKSFQEPIITVNDCVSSNGIKVQDREVVLLETIPFVHSNSRKTINVDLKVKNVPLGLYDCSIKLCIDYSCKNIIASKSLKLEVI